MTWIFSGFVKYLFNLSAVIGRPEFKLEVGSDKKKITLHVTDMPTALYNEKNERLSIRDVFKDELQYKVIYRKAKSTGKVSLVSSCFLHLFGHLHPD